MVFEPRGDKPLWRLVYDKAVERGAGSSLPFSDLADMLGYDPAPVGASRAPIRKASARLASEGLTLVSLRGVGYGIETLAPQPASARDPRVALDAVADVLSGQAARIAAIEFALRDAGISVPSP